MTVQTNGLRTRSRPSCSQSSGPRGDTAREDMVATTERYRRRIDEPAEYHEPHRPRSERSALTRRGRDDRGSDQVENADEFSWTAGP